MFDRYGAMAIPTRAWQQDEEADSECGHPDEEEQISAEAIVSRFMNRTPTTNVSAVMSVALRGSTTSSGVLEWTGLLREGRRPARASRTIPESV